ncbi:MAG: UPF0149 family protein [Gammaproteobacteria bacterium]|nr:UPF0149 family protein [Gammaproteobacteria bacterium]HXK55997.1 UPF0149 family protein [Gammaproteobacteria bacterium]
MSDEHEEVERRLASADLELSGAEVHGLLCGLLCGTAADAAERWFAELFPQAEAGDLLREECQHTLRRLYERTLASIADPGMGFELLLPSDRKPIRLRASGVRDWCEGFLYGLGLAGAADENAFAQSTRESLIDIGEIARMNIDDLSDGDEEEEEALMQVTEFLRVAVLLTYDDLAGKRAVQ